MTAEIPYLLIDKDTAQVDYYEIALNDVIIEAEYPPDTDPAYGVKYDFSAHMVDLNEGSNHFKVRACNQWGCSPEGKLTFTVDRPGNPQYNGMRIEWL